MMKHQIEFSQAIQEIYKPISGRMSDPNSIVPTSNPEGVRACEEYEAVVKDMQETLAPELEMIDTRVVKPANELMEVIKAIRKTATKRDHKQLDFDRRRATLKKLQDKKEKTMKDEKAMYKAEAEMEQSTQEFNYFNDLLKDELPKLFTLEAQFIQPLFQSFYYMQLNVFYTLHEKMQACDIGYFDLTRDLEEAFNEKRGDIQEQAEKLSIVRFKTSGFKRPPKYGKPAALLESSHQPALITAGPSSGSSSPAPSSATTSKFGGNQYNSHHSELSGDSAPPPPYSPGPAGGSIVGEKSSMALAAAAKAKPPPPKPKPSRLSGAPTVETVTALYDYSATAEGDLSFVAGDVIEIVSKTANPNEWWTGKCKGKTGQFPGELQICCRCEHLPARGSEQPMLRVPEY